MGLLALLHQTQFAKEHLLAPLAARRGRPRASPRAAPGQFRSGPHKKNSQAGKRGSGEEGSTWGRAARGSGRAFSQIGAAPESRAGGRARPRRSSAAHPAAPGARHAGRRAPRFAPPRTTEGNSAVPREGKNPASHAAAKAPSIPRERSPRPRPPPPLAPESRVPAAPTVSAVRPLGAISSSPFCRLPRRAGAGPGAAVRARRSPLHRSFPEPGRATRAAPAARPQHPPAAPCSVPPHGRAAPRRFSAPPSPLRGPALPLRTAPGGSRDTPGTGLLRCAAKPVGFCPVPEAARCPRVRHRLRDGRAHAAHSNRSTWRPPPSFKAYSFA